MFVELFCLPAKRRDCSTMLFKIIPLGALAASFTREDGETFYGTPGEWPPQRCCSRVPCLALLAFANNSDGDHPYTARTAIMGRTARTAIMGRTARGRAWVIGS